MPTVPLPASPSPRGGLVGRDNEWSHLNSFLDSARLGHGGGLVVRGEPGIGKSALIDAAVADSEDFLVLRALGVEAEHTWSWAGLSMLLQPLLDRRHRLPEAQRVALSNALGLAEAGPRAPRLQVGLAVLNLLVEASADRPVCAVIDDAHWLDADSTEALLFASRRMATESVAVVMAARDGFAPDFAAPGIPELNVGPLDMTSSDVLVNQRGDDISYSGRDWILRTAGGNPLALLELPVADHEDGGVTTSNSRFSTTSRIRQAFTERIISLPEPTRMLLLVAAAEETGDNSVIVEAAGKLGATVADLEPAERDGLVRFHMGRIEFVHPLIRSASYHSAPRHRRIDARRALSETFGPDDIRHAWHLAAATTGQDETAAAALESIASFEADRGGCIAEMSALERAASFTPDLEVRASRLIRAAQSAYVSCLAEKAITLASEAERLSNNPEILARAALIRATVWSWTGESRAFEMWMSAADHYATSGHESTGYPLLRGVWHAWETGDFTQVEHAARRAEAYGGSNNEWARRLARAAAGLNRRSASAGEAVESLRSLYEYYRPLHEDFVRFDRILSARWRLLAGDTKAAYRLASEEVTACRKKGATSPLVQALAVQAEAQFEFARYADAQAAATSAIELLPEQGERRALMQTRLWVLLPIAAVRGDEKWCRELVAAAVNDAPADSVVPADTALGLLDLGLGRYKAAFERLWAIAQGVTPMEMLRDVPNLVEAAHRCGRETEVTAVFEWFCDWARATGQRYWEALVERCHGLLGDEADAGAHFAKAIELHRADDVNPFERARTALTYGEWLRRARRINEARIHLRDAVETFERLGAAPWTERGKSELRAAGDSQRVEGSLGLADRLTPQELQVVRLAADGLTNRQIGEQLFISPRTVGYHLYNAYPKLGVSSRAELARVEL
ncbi:helix-turn-helix transcriptional regulator [Haloglycomyces albus]|uniref:helix-turn-helix transcriptional regulator n=1 Tax=Haloglycomyces albus TaxID=526067 RepID=UPI0006880DB3|nr:AAA family ATPase [Haloglycomyces albus]